MKHEIIIDKDISLMSALKLMDELKCKLLLVTSLNTFIGVLSVGDIQRAIIKNITLDTKVHEILRSIITVANSDEKYDDIKKRMLELRTECMPVVDEKNELVDILFWDDLFENKEKVVSKIGLPVVIMAGGKGTRLKPLTNVIPKPLIPVGEKTMIETIIESFTKYGVEEFHISVNYKSDLIKYYLDSNPVENATLGYFEETMPLGTAGSLSLLKDKIDKPFFVTNCDIIVDQDYTEIYKYHKENKNELTVVAALKHISIPYGTLETGEDGILKTITEKPELTYWINSGLYILEPSLLDEIPENTFYHITTLIEKLKSSNRRVGVFPVSEDSWKDVGEWNEYFKFIKLDK